MVGSYPESFGVRIDAATVRPSWHTLIGGSPLRVMRLSAAGSRVVTAWGSGAVVGESEGARRLARRLVDAGLAHPRPPAGVGPSIDAATIVIPVRDRQSGLESTLRGLQGLDVLIVDDGSLEPVEARASRVVRRDAAGGPAAARNTGWRSAASDIVVFLDADCEPHAGWLDRLLPHFADPVVGAVAPRVRSVPGPGLLARYERVMSPLDMGPAEASVRPGGRVPYVPTACLAARRCVLEKCGGFDEALRFGEDVDLVWRIVSAGWTVLYEPTAVVSHPPRASLRSWAGQRFDYGRSAAPLSARHGPSAAPAAFSPWSAAAWALVAAGRTTTGAALAGGLSALVAARAGQDSPTRRTLALLAIRGHLMAGRSLATAVRRAWTPPLLLALLLPLHGVRRRIAISLALSFFWPLAERAAPASTGEKATIGPLSWMLLRWSDDLAYQSGVWAGALERRSLRALVPRRVSRRRPSPVRRYRSPGSPASAAGAGPSSGSR